MVLVILVTWILSLLTVLPIAYFVFHSPASPYAKITSDNLATGAVTSTKISDGSVSAEKLDDDVLPVFSEYAYYLRMNRTAVNAYDYENMSIWNITISRDSRLLIWLTTRIWVNATGANSGVSLWLYVDDSGPSLPNPLILEPLSKEPYNSLRYTGTQTYTYQWWVGYDGEGGYDLQDVTIRTTWHLWQDTTVAEGFVYYTVLVLPS
jgi:hypothetical protein